MSRGPFCLPRDHLTSTESEACDKRPRWTLDDESRHYRCLAQSPKDPIWFLALTVDGIIFPNPLPFMSEARLLVMSSRWKGFGNVLVERPSSTEAPVASTYLPAGSRKVLSDGELGRLVPVGDTLALADTIVPALNEEQEPRRLRVHVAEFSAARSADSYLRAMVFCPTRLKSTPVSLGSNADS